MMQTPEAIDATSKISITLQAGEWNQVLGVLSDAPYKMVAPLIAQMTQQASMQAQQIAAQQAQEQRGGPLPNGHAEMPN